VSHGSQGGKPPLDFSRPGAFIEQAFIEGEILTNEGTGAPSSTIAFEGGARVVAADVPPLVDTIMLDGAARMLVEAIGDGREGMLETPARVAKFWREFFTVPPIKLTVFDAEGTDQMVVQAGIPFYSLCEHHLLPFFGTAIVAYLPSQKIVGLSKLARAVEFFARRAQNQERITRQVAELLHNTIDPKGVGVLLRGRHMCMEMRGVKAAGAVSTTIELLGVFRDDARTRAEFMTVVANG
jgi:GTP cyclohydrolase I